MIFALQFAFNSPTELGIGLIFGSQPKRLHVASVIPHPCFSFGPLVGQRDSHSAIMSPESGAAPEPISITELRSVMVISKVGKSEPRCGGFFLVQHNLQLSVPRCEGDLLGKGVHAVFFRQGRLGEGL